VLDDDDFEGRLATWDYHKQNRAVQGMVHFFANIEENPELFSVSSSSLRTLTQGTRHSRTQ